MQETEFQCLLRGLPVVCPSPGYTQAPALAGGPDSKAAFCANRKLAMALEKRKLRCYGTGAAGAVRKTKVRHKTVPEQKKVCRMCGGPADTAGALKCCGKVPCPEKGPKEKRLHAGAACGPGRGKVRLWCRAGRRRMNKAPACSGAEQMEYACFYFKVRTKM